MVGQRRKRSGFSLIEIIIVLAVVAGVLAAGVAVFGNDSSDQVRESTYDALGVLQRARNTAVRQGNAVVVIIWGTGSDPGAGQTAGRIDAFVAADANCPGTRPTAGAYEQLILTTHGGSPYEGAGIARISPVADQSSDPLELCFRPNGRVLDRTTAAPFAAAEDVDFAGDAHVWFQFGPTSDPGGTLAVPRGHIVIPYTGVARLER